MELKFTQEYFIKVTPEHYRTEKLSGVGTFEEQICEYEKKVIERNDHFLIDMRRGELKVEVVPESPYKFCGDSPDNHGSHRFTVMENEQLKWFTCTGKRESEFVEAEVTCIHCLSKTCGGCCKESEMNEDNDPQN